MEIAMNKRRKKKMQRIVVFLPEDVKLLLDEQVEGGRASRSAMVRALLDFAVRPNYWLSGQRYDDQCE
jgi:metal-responsive CopG/Arc/MetJ family transcriptional regulator